MEVSINISEENIRRLNHAKEKTGLSFDDIIGGLVEKIPLPKQTEESLPVKKIDKNAELIIDYYKEIYRKKFAIDTDEEIDVDLVSDKIKDLDSSIEDMQTVIDIIKKAIVWYIYQYDNVGKDGQIYPYKLKLLIGQNFIFRKCIESSKSVDLELLLKAQSQNLSQKELLSAMRRGDVVGTVSQDSPTMLMEQALDEVADLIREKGFGKDFKKHPKIKGLYTSDVPSLEYTRKALRFIQSIRERNDE